MKVSSSGTFYLVNWLIQAICMITFNKYLFSVLKFNFPCLLILWHMISSTILTQILSKIDCNDYNFLPAVREGKINWTTYLKTFIPMGIFFSLNLVLSNMAYKYISIGYIQMLKAIQPLPLLTMSILVGRSQPSLTQFSFVLVISLGVVIATLGELRFNLLGFLLQLMGVIFECVRTTILDLVLSNQNQKNRFTFYALLFGSC